MSSSKAGSDNFKAKELLREYGDLLQENDRQIQRLDRLKKLAAPTASQEIRIIELEEIIKARVEAEQEKGARLESLVQQLVKADERAVIQMRYFDLAAWPGIIVSLYGDKPDFVGHETTYERKVFRLHNRALKALDRLLEKEARNETDL